MGMAFLANECHIILLIYKYKVLFRSRTHSQSQFQKIDPVRAKLKGSSTRNKIIDSKGISPF